MRVKATDDMFIAFIHNVIQAFIIDDAMYLIWTRIRHKIMAKVKTEKVWDYYPVVAI